MRRPDTSSSIRRPAEGRHGRRIPPRRAGLGLVLALAASSLAAPSHAQTDGAAEPRGRVVVSGEGRVSSAPDMAVLRLGVEADAEEAGDALRAASDAARAVLDALRDAGVAEADVQTSALSLNPRYGERADITGYVATNVVTARVRGIESVGSVLDAATAAGANRIDGLSFSLADPAPAVEEARRRAVDDARAAAETFADAAGAALGPVLRLEEGGAGGGPGPMADFARAEAISVPIASGEVDTVVRVRAVYALETSGP